MIKAKDAPLRPQSKKSRHARTPKAKKVDLTLDQRIRLAAFDELMKWSDEQWEKMTPKQQKEEMEGWERVKKTINGDRAGYRQVFVDE